MRAADSARVVHLCACSQARIVAHKWPTHALRLTQALCEENESDMSDVINFYSVSDDYGELSNFALYPIKIKGKVWPTSEHYFQAMKFESQKDQAEIRKAKTPMEAAKKGRDRKRKLRKNWESSKDNVMREAVLQKFSQHENLKELLLSTGSSKLVEHTENDKYWGDGGDGRGKNRLGIILMEVRERLGT